MKADAVISISLVHPSANSFYHHFKRRYQNYSIHDRKNKKICISSQTHIMEM